MAFTETQKTEIRRYLGYADPSLEPYWNLESRLDVVSATTETAIEALLTRLATLETKLEGAWTRAGLKRAEDVEFYQGGEARTELLAEGRRLCVQIGRLLGIKLEHTAFDGPDSTGLCGSG